MQYPIIILVPGKDIKKVVKNLKIANVKFKINFMNENATTKLFIESYNWPNDLEDGVELKDIQEGLQLSFFKSEPVELTWNPEKYSINWIFDIWKISIQNDVNCWFSKKPSIIANCKEKLLLNIIIDKCLKWDTDILEIYNILLPIFQHPNIANLLRKCIDRKESHVNMWHQIKYKFILAPFKNQFTKPIVFVTILSQVVNNLSQIITAEEILNPMATQLLTLFSKKNQLTEFIKLIQRRDQESQQHSESLIILLSQIEKLYPFLTKAINHCTILGKYYAYKYDKSFKYF